MKSPEYVVHGTSAEKDALSIEEEGFEALEGRATVSGDLIYAYDWAINTERRRGSQSETEIEKNSPGRILVMKVPEEMSVDYATHTDVAVNDSEKEITGYSSKYESGRKQLALYSEGDVVEKRDKIEMAKQMLRDIVELQSKYLEENGLNSNKINSKENLISAISEFEIEKRIEILKQVEDFEKQKSALRNETQSEVTIEEENVLMSVVPTPELGEKLEELSQKIRALETVDIENFIEEITVLIEKNSENFLASGLDVRATISELIEATLEAEVVNMVRTLSLDIKRARGFTVYNRGREEVKEKDVDIERLREKLSKIHETVINEDFNIGKENLNRYLSINIKKLSRELDLA